MRTKLVARAWRDFRYTPMSAWLPTRGSKSSTCDVGARNSLDLNYLARAESRQAEVRPLHIARVIEPQPDGYRVRFERIEDGTLVPGEVSARPPITAAVDYLDGQRGGQRFFIEDGGFPDLLRNYLTRLDGRDGGHPLAREFINTVRFILSRTDAFERVMPWFAQGRDAANGTLSLRAGRLFLDWDIDVSEAVINAIVETHKDFARSTAGLPLVPSTWTVARHLITPHPLGACNMGQTPDEGVVNHAGEIFGYRNLYVADGPSSPKRWA
jgi:cholesterol oxidase